MKLRRVSFELEEVRRRADASGHRASQEQLETARALEEAVHAMREHASGVLADASMLALGGGGAGEPQAARGTSGGLVLVLVGGRGMAENASPPHLPRPWRRCGRSAPRR